MIDAWKWMGRARAIESVISALDLAKKHTKDQILRITQNYESDGAQSTKDPHKFDKLAEYESLIDQKIDEQLAIKEEITQAISYLQDGRQQAILTHYYINMLSLEETAAKVKYSYPHVKRLRAKAIREIQKYLDEQKMIHNDPSKCNIMHDR